MSERKRFFRLLSVLVVLSSVLLVMVCSMLVTGTKTRYIKREQDEVRAYYTGLYFAENGDGSPVALENNVGYVDFQIMNYIDDDVTKRDITYDITTVSTFYDGSGNVIADPSSSSVTELHVKDVWNAPVKVGRDSYKYNVSITKNDGEKRIESVNGVNKELHLFSYEERDESAVGKIHNVTVKLERKPDAGAMSGSTESVSLVIQLNKPYKQVYIVDIIVSNRLIVFGSKQVKEFDMDFTKVNVQTFDIFSHYLNGTSYAERVNAALTKFSSRAFKVVFEWDNMIINENDFKYFHNNPNSILAGTPDAEGLDLSRPYLVNITQTADSGTLTIYVPQSSDFEFGCLITDTNAYLKAMVYIWDNTTGKYVVYDQVGWGGYTDNSTLGLAEIIK